MHKIYIDSHSCKLKFRSFVKKAKCSKVNDNILEKILFPLVSLTILSTNPDTESERLFFNIWKKSNRKEKHSLTKLLLQVIKE